MSSVPIVRQVSIFGFAFVVAICVALVALALAVTPEHGVFAGLAAFYTWFFLVRFVIASSHRRGMRLVRRRQFEEAIAQFERSYSYFSKHVWLDRARAIVMLSASKTSYREMALCNLAFCHAQLGRGAEARDLYERVLKSFPDSGLATAGLAMLRAGANL